jgi:DNA-binding MarR family transcriptional regulator
MSEHETSTTLLARPLSEDLMDVVGRLRRATRRKVRRDWPHQPLAESELELLRLVVHSPGTRVQDASAALGLAPNTVSTLVGKLSAAGLLSRTADPEDGRAARLHLTPAAERRIGDWRARRRDIVGGAMHAMPTADRRAIAAALPALQHLVDLLEEP